LSEIAVGIDLGTTNSCVAYMVDGRPTIIPGPGGGTITPSVVCVDDRGNLIVGQQAKRRFLTHPQDTIYGAKRLMGRRFGSEEMEEIRSNFFYDIVEGENREPRIRAGDKTFGLEDISALILGQLVDSAQEYLEQRISKAVISVPAYFTQRQREAVRKAGEMADLEVLRIINEPTAAALAYGFGKRNAQRILVYDLGGGTFDVTILQLYEEVYEVVGTGGDSFLGGIDFDNALVEEFCRRFEQQHGVDVRQDKVALQRLRDAAERAKIDISTVEDTTVNLPFLVMQEGNSLDFETVLTRQEYEQLTEPLITKTLKIAERTLREANINRDQLDEVIFVGGMTRSPLVFDLVSKYFGRRPRKAVHPDEVVAQGAAILADAIREGRAGVTLVDVLPVSIGIGVGRGEFRKVINKNTTIPIEHKQLFRTTRDNQTGVRIKVYQGESRKVANNEFLGELQLGGFPKLPKGQVQVEIKFSVDEDSILHVRAKELKGGREIKARFITEALVQRERYRADKILHEEADAPTESATTGRQAGAASAPPADTADADGNERVSTRKPSRLKRWLSAIFGRSSSS